MAASGGQNAGLAAGVLVAVIGTVAGSLMDSSIEPSDGRDIAGNTRKAAEDAAQAESSVEAESEDTEENLESQALPDGSQSILSDEKDVDQKAGKVKEDSEEIVQLVRDNRQALSLIKEIDEEADVPNLFDKVIGFVEDGDIQYAKQTVDANLDGKYEEEFFESLTKSAQDLSKITDLEADAVELVDEQIKELEDETQRIENLFTGEQKEKLEEIKQRQISELNIIKQELNQALEHDEKIETMEEKLVN